jgi:hypothetical protein
VFFFCAAVLKPEFRAKDSSWTCVGLIPILHAVVGSEHLGFKAAKDQLYHDCIKAVSGDFVGIFLVFTLRYFS